jgi:sporulation protein YunB
MRYTVRRRISLPKLPNISKKWLMLFLVSGLIVYAFYVSESHLKPTLLAIAEARATAIATTTINNVINEQISQGLDYQNLVSVKVDDRGRVVLMQPNTVEFNRLASHVTIKVQESLRQISEEKIRIPFGQVLGSQILASYGPKITVTVIPIGTVQVKVIDTFEQAGINQTKHMIYIVANTQVRIVVPLVSKSVEVITRVPISEYVVMGEVPNTYVQIPFPLSNLFKNGEGTGSINGNGQP